MRSRKGVRSVCIALLLVLAGALPATAAPLKGSPSALAPTDGVCPNGNVCLWENASYTGARLVISTCCSWINLDLFGFNDIMSSWKNRMTVDAKWAFNAGGGGTQRCMNSGSQNPNVADNDQASSVKIFSSSTAC